MDFAQHGGSGYHYGHDFPSVISGYLVRTGLVWVNGHHGAVSTVDSVPSQDSLHCVLHCIVTDD